MQSRTLLFNLREARIQDRPDETETAAGTGPPVPPGPPPADG